MSADDLQELQRLINERKNVVRLAKLDSKNFAVYNNGEMIGMVTKRRNSVSGSNRTVFVVSMFDNKGGEFTTLKSATTWLVKWYGS